MSRFQLYNRETLLNVFPLKTTQFRGKFEHWWHQWHLSNAPVPHTSKQLWVVGVGAALASQTVALLRLLQEVFVSEPRPLIVGGIVQIRSAASVGGECLPLGGRSISELTFCCLAAKFHFALRPLIKCADQGPAPIRSRSPHNPMIDIVIKSACHWVIHGSWIKQ